MSFWQKLFEKNKEENKTSPVRSPNFDEARFKVKNLGEQALEKVTEKASEQDVTLLNSETPKKDIPKFVGSSRVNDNQDFITHIKRTLFNPNINDNATIGIIF